MKHFSRRYGQGSAFQQGMTLIEVVIALVLFALIALALVSGMNTMGQTLTKSSQRIDQINDMRLITKFLRQTMSSTQPFFAPTADGRNADFQGDEHSLWFVGNMSGYQGPGGLHLIHLYTQPEGENKLRLLMQFTPWRPGANWTPDFSQVKPKLLIEGLTRFDLHYMTPETSSTWLPQWTRLDHYPAAIRLQIAVDGRYWPEMVIWVGGAKNGPR